MTTIAELMTRKPCILAKDASIFDAVQMMAKENCGILPIGEASNIVGVVTDRDILIRAIAQQKDLNKTPITFVMTPDVLFCSEDDSLQTATQQMMQHNRRRVLVMDAQQTLIGILSLGDIIRRIHGKGLLAELVS